MYRPLRIAIIGMGGVTRDFRHWPERVIGGALERRGHHVVNIGYHDPRVPALALEHEEIDNIDVYRVPVRHWPNDELWRALERTDPFDIVYLLHPRNVLAYGATVWAKRHKVPTVYTWLGPLHDRYVVSDRERPYDSPPHFERIIWTRREALRRAASGGRMRDQMRNFWLHAPLKQADLLLPCSQHEEMLLREMGLTQPSKVVPLWLDYPTIYQVPEVPIELPRPALLFIGQLTPRKGYDLLLRALPEVVYKYPGATVQFVSGLNQEDRAVLEHQARELGVADRIVLRGRIEDDELVNLYRSADLYVTPTRYEGFGLTLLEAMAAGCPLVSSDIPVVNELVQHGVNGWLTRYDDPQDLARGILTLLNDAALRERLVAGGHHTLATRFREELLVGQIEDAFTELLPDKTW